VLEKSIHIWNIGRGCQVPLQDMVSAVSMDVLGLNKAWHWTVQPVKEYDAVLTIASIQVSSSRLTQY
jgi:hypothetical protein